LWTIARGFNALFRVESQYIKSGMKVLATFPHSKNNFDEHESILLPETFVSAPNLFKSLAQR
jgi:hypothetical protein